MERLLALAVGSSARSKVWKNTEMSWEALCGLLARETRSAESAADFRRMSAAERAKAKDRGGFVGGKLSGNRRKREAVVSRSMLTLDADAAGPDFIDNFLLSWDCAGCVYTTHSHTPEAPRVRVVIPLLRDVNIDEFQALSRYVAAELGIDAFDPCSHYPHQLMYWPSCPRDGVFRFERTDGPMLDPDSYLSAHPEWRDVSLLPTGKSEAVLRGDPAGHREDPRKKEGLIGDFCRAYSITGAIAAFLSGVYYPTANPARWGLIGSESQPGLVIYDDDLFAYSQHAGDPAYGVECNAFDLVRIHLFEDEDEKGGLQKMLDLVRADEGVRTLQAEELGAELRELQDAAEAGADDDLSWLKSLERDRLGVIEDSILNLDVILTHDPNLRGIGYNLLKYGKDTRGGLPWTQMKAGWSDAEDLDSLVVYLSKHYGRKNFSKERVKTVLNDAAKKRAWHPIREYLDTLPPWDGVERVERLLVTYLGAEDSEYTRAVTRKTLAAAVARVYAPGIKFDSVLILVGPQACGKSTLFNRLGGQWFSDSLTLTDMKDKTGAEKLQGFWILELGELAGMRKAEVETVKSFLSTQDDKFRGAYQPTVESHPRQCVIVGSTNAEAGFLRDITGNRRFWPVRVSGKAERKPWELDAATVGQIWAEALNIYRRGDELLYLTGEAAAAAEAVQAEAMETDEREGLVEAFLELRLPEMWEFWDRSAREQWLHEEPSMREQGTHRRVTVCNLEIWCECFGRDAALMRKQDSYEISAIMLRIPGWTRGEKGKRLPLYGFQRFYKRKEQA